MKILRIFKTNKDTAESFVNDRRRAKRYDVLLKLNYSDPSTSLKGEALTKNICKNGLRFPVEKIIPKGTLLDVKIEDPYGDNPILSRAKIAWVEEFIAGESSEDISYEVGARLLKKQIY